MTDKQKIIKYLNAKGISKNKFYKETGFSVGFLDSGSSLGVDKLRIIIDKYHDLNPKWVVSNEGQMIQDATKTYTEAVQEQPAEYGKECESCKEKERLIKSLEQTIDAYQNTIKAQNIALEVCQKHCKETHTKKQTTN